MGNTHAEQKHVQKSRKNLHLLCCPSNDAQIIMIQVNEKSCRLRMGAYRDGVKRKRDKIGMGV